jgi:predicted DNA-binding transcriptional regulator YafY
METKKLHKSQENVLPFEEHDDGTYGEFSIDVEVNNEFIGRILQMGDGLEVVAPKEVRDIFRKRVDKMAELYKKDHQ